MIISVVAMHVRLTALYKYILLQEELEKIGVNFRLYISGHQYKNFILKMADDLKNNPAYTRYYSRIKKLNVISVEGKSRTVELQKFFLYNLNPIFHYLKKIFAILPF